MSEPILRVERLHVWFDLPHGAELHAVQGIDLELQAGERFGLVGESGCGKTTTVLALMGLLPSSASVSGRILLRGEDLLADGEVSMRPHRWKDIAMIFQGAMNALNPVQTVGSQIVEPMELHEIAEGAQARARAGELLELVGIPADRAAPPIPSHRRSVWATTCSNTPGWRRNFKVSIPAVMARGFPLSVPA